MDDLNRAPHRRFNPLTREWVLVSPHRLSRPWQGETFSGAPPPRPPYDAQCYLCPGNARANGERNPDYAQTFAFDNDYAALLPGIGAHEFRDDGLLTARNESGRCRVLCFSPRHDLDISTMRIGQVRAVVDAWAQEYGTLMDAGGISAVTIFENRGSMMGASNPHPHSQIWANESVPDALVKESEGFSLYRSAHGRCLLCAYAEREIELGERVIYGDEEVCAVVPFWAVWPFEALLMTRRHAADLTESADAMRDALAKGMCEITSRYDRLFHVPFPYSMGWHQGHHVHAHYYPPLLRSASVRKYLVGYEMLAGPQRDMTPEEAAARMRSA
jgi:UDPglucose--hexose-1-phosphate uridylyltransferase